MIVSTRGRYALRVMLDIIKHQDEGYVPLRLIAERQRISPKYLETIMGQLQKAGLVTGARGKGGGYMLPREPKDYRILEILEVTEGTLAPVACLERGVKVNECPMRDNCPTLPMWEKLMRTVEDFFAGITLEDLAEGRIGVDDLDGGDDDGSGAEDFAEAGEGVAAGTCGAGSTAGTSAESDLSGRSGRKSYGKTC